jgi:hypothetical protein
MFDHDKRMKDISEQMRKLQKWDSAEERIRALEETLTNLKEETFHNQSTTLQFE